MSALEPLILAPGKVKRGRAKPLTPVEPKHPLEDAPLTHPLLEANAYTNSLMIKAKSQPRTRVLIGTPVTGNVRIEWVHARYSQIVPPNWTSAESLQPLHQAMPLNYSVAEARNVLAKVAMDGGFDWLLSIDHDVILPPNAFILWNEWMRLGTHPLVSGLYWIKGHPSEPLAYRGLGNSAYMKFKVGDQVWVSGCGFGALLLHVSILRAMAADAPTYVAGGNVTCAKIFDSPYAHYVDPETGHGQSYQGTEDLAFFTRMMTGKYLAKAGWHAMAKRTYPIMLDTCISCGHITQDGVVYPLGWKPLS